MNLLTITVDYQHLVNNTTADEITLKIKNGQVFVEYNNGTKCQIDLENDREENTIELGCRDDDNQEVVLYDDEYAAIMEEGNEPENRIDYTDVRDVAQQLYQEGGIDAMENYRDRLNGHINNRQRLEELMSESDDDENNIANLVFDDSDSEDERPAQPLEPDEEPDPEDLSTVDESEHNQPEPEVEIEIVEVGIEPEMEPEECEPEPVDIMSDDEDEYTGLDYGNNKQYIKYTKRKVG